MRGSEHSQTADAGTQTREADAETAPLSIRSTSSTTGYRRIAEVWRHGSIISSRLLDLTAAAGACGQSELRGVWRRVSIPARAVGPVQAAIEVGVPAYVLSAALYSRFESRGRGRVR